jgi:hypothetical protein
MGSSKRFVVAVVVLLVVLAPLAGLAFLLFPPDFAYSHYSTYSYTTSITTNGTVENATILLPYPDGPDVDAPPADLWIYDDDGTRITDWNATVVQTVHGPMLQLRVDRLVGVDRYVLWTYAPNGSPLDRQVVGPGDIPDDMTNRELVPDPTRYSVTWQVSVDHAIETRTPVGNGTFLAPVADVSTVDCRDPWDDSETCGNFTTVASATYDAATPVTLTLGAVQFEGWNEWGFWLSNSFNTFEATTDAVVYTDGRQGWSVVDGRMRAGVGRYDGPKR